MADPLSALGAVAAASQLAGSVVKIIEIARNLHQEYRSPKITQQRLAQIETVRSSPYSYCSNYARCRCSPSIGSRASIHKIKTDILIAY
jgi:hypothetical protein